MLGTFLAYCLYLAATLALEAIVVGLLAPAAQRRRALIVCVAANLFTHPFATLLSWHWFVDWFAIEALVTLIEFACYLRLVPLRPARALALAVAANLLTAVAGLVWWAFGIS